MVSLLLLQSPKSKGFDVYIIFSYTNAEDAIWKNLHGGARGDHVQFSIEKMEVSTCEKLILFCTYSMLC